MTKQSRAVLDSRTSAQSQSSQESCPLITGKTGHLYWLSQSCQWWAGEEFMRVYEFILKIKLIVISWIISLNSSRQSILSQRCWDGDRQCKTLTNTTTQETNNIPSLRDSRSGNADRPQNCCWVCDSTFGLRGYASMLLFIGYLVYLLNKQIKYPGLHSDLPRMA